MDAADYVVWRSSLGAIVATPYTGADGNGNGVVDQERLRNLGSPIGATSPGSGAAASARSLDAAAMTNTTKAELLSALLTGVHLSNSNEESSEFFPRRQFKLFPDQPFDRLVTTETAKDLLLGRFADSQARSPLHLNLPKTAAREAIDSVFDALDTDLYHDNGPLCHSLAEETIAGVAMKSRLL